VTTKVSHPRELLQLVGRPIGSTSWREITQAEVNQFADATGDHQWIHVDVERARKGPYGGPIAHGYLTLALAPVFLFEVLEVEGATSAVNYGVNKVRFPAPVPIGSKVRAHITLAGAEERKTGVEAVFQIAYELEGSQRPPCVAEVVSLYT
jgi:acyl dehydratase